ncbi:hypothetical protein GF314_06940 [bacterium]|nr:hypothetical protein [bacterium]
MHCRCIGTAGLAIERIPRAVQHSEFDWFDLDHDGQRVGKARCPIERDRVRFTARGVWKKVGFRDRGDGNWEFSSG